MGHLKGIKAKKSVPKSLRSQNTRTGQEDPGQGHPEEGDTVNLTAPMAARTDLIHRRDLDPHLEDQGHHHIKAVIKTNIPDPKSQRKEEDQDQNLLLQNREVTYLLVLT